MTLKEKIDRLEDMAKFHREDASRARSSRKRKVLKDHAAFLEDVAADMKAYEKYLFNGQTPKKWKID